MNLRQKSLQRSYYLKNKDKYKERYLLNKVRISELAKIRYQLNKENRKRIQREYYADNRNECKDKKKIYYQKNKEEIKRKSREYKLAHPSIVANQKIKFGTEYHRKWRLKVAKQSFIDEKEKIIDKDNKFLFKKYLKIYNDKYRK